MYKFLYNKSVDLIEKIMFRAQLIVFGILIIGHIVGTCFDGQGWVWIVAALLWWVVYFADGLFYLYKSRVVCLSKIKSSFELKPNSEIESGASGDIHRLNDIAISAKKNELICIGASKLLLATLLIAFLLI